MKPILCHLTLFLVTCAVSQALAQDRLETSGELNLGAQQRDLDTDSAKFNEYRDIQDGFNLFGLRFDLLDNQSGLLLDFAGSNILRDDQSLLFRVADFSRRWSLVVNRHQIPRRMSNRAFDPYLPRGDGLFTVPSRVPIVKDANPATGTPSLVPTPDQMAINDLLVADYLVTHLRPLEVRSQRNRTGAAFGLSLSEETKFRLTFSDELRQGDRTTFGPIGDRPPRTLNSQLVEPVAYNTRELRAEADFSRNWFQGNFSYLFSTFDNRVESLRWENFYFAPDLPLDFITTEPNTPRNVSQFGQRSLAPDNHFHNIALSGGVNLPRGSRLAATTAFGLMRQNERLLPYSFSTLGGDLDPAFGDELNWNDPNKLLRTHADADMRTFRLDADYSINPIARLNLRAFARYHDLNNRTPIGNWRYVTQDVAGTNGSVNYRNFRRNLAYAHDKTTLGVDLSHYLRFWRTTLGLGYEFQAIDRDFREANTDENTLKASVRLRPANRLSIRAAYRFGDRDGSPYDYNITRLSYWYTFEQGAADPDNPQFLFGNHPDLRKYDVSDRKRNLFDFSSTLAIRQDFDLSVSYRFRNDDFDSRVQSIAPLAGTTVPLPNPADANAMTPGQQQGLLEEQHQDLTVNFHYAPVERWSLNFFVNREHLDSPLRGMVFNENQRREPSNPAIQLPTALGPWTDPNRLFDTRIENRTSSFGVGFDYNVTERLRFFTGYSLSRGRVDLEYTGYGSDPAFLGRDWETFQFGFNDPETVRQNQNVFNGSVEYALVETLTLGLHYTYDHYGLTDWMQEPLGPWVEEVGSEFFLRDTSRDNRWGNRLVNMGGYLAPGYSAHVGSISMRYRF